jgi:hypothetical protein
MTAHHEPKRDRRHQTRPIESGAERHGRRMHGFMAEQDLRRSWPERELIRQLGANLYNSRPENSR